MRVVTVLIKTADYYSFPIASQIALIARRTAPHHLASQLSRKHDISGRFMKNVKVVRVRRVPVAVRQQFGMILLKTGHIPNPIPLVQNLKLD